MNLSLSVLKNYLIEVENDVNEDDCVENIEWIKNNIGDEDVSVREWLDMFNEYWDKVMSINLDAQFILAREIGKKMIAKGYGKIIFTASLLSFQGGINVPGYAAAKSAIGGLVKALSNEWASQGVNVNGIAPGYIETDNTKALREDEQRNKSILSRIPAGRWGQPNDFKGPTVFLASDASSYVHGTLLVVDGGWMGR